jgi:hypothetical protein
MGDQPGSDGVAPTGFGPAKQYERHGGSDHKSGWQEHPGGERPDAVEGARRAPLAPDGSIPRTPLAERLEKLVAEHGED